MLSMKLAAAFAAAVLVAASCGGGAEPEAPEPAEEVQAPVDPEPETPKPVESEPEPEPVEASEPAPEPAESVPEPPCPAGDHRHDDDGACHPEDPEPVPEPEPVKAAEEPEPVSEPFDEEIEDFDPAEHVPADPSTDPDGHPCERIDDNDDGVPGVCTIDGERFCYSETGWGDCPGGDITGDACPAVEAGDALAFTGTSQITGQWPLVWLDDGTWRIDACLEGNDLTTGEPSRFTVSLFTPPNDEGTGKGGVLFDVESVVSWKGTTEIGLVWGDLEPMPFEVEVTPVGGGTWTLHMTKVGEAS